MTNNVIDINQCAQPVDKPQKRPTFEGCARHGSSLVMYVQMRGKVTLFRPILLEMRDLS